MKKFLSLFLATVMVLSLAACGEKTEEPTTVDTPPEVVEEAFKPDYKTLNVICPFAAGGAVDTYCRLVSKYASNYTDINLVVTNVAGSSGTIGMSEVLSHNADGSYMAAFNVGPGWCNTKDRTIPYTDQDFVGVAGLFSASQLLMVPVNSDKFDSFDSFIAYCKEHDGEVSIGTSGTGNIPFFSVLEINRKYDLNIKVVTYDGETEALAAVLGGHIDGMVSSTVTATSIIKNNQALPILILTENREAAFEDVPCMGEYGFEFTMPSHRSFYMKAGTDERILEYWSDIIEQICANPDFAKEAEEAGLIIDFIDWKADTEELHTVIANSEEVLTMYGYK